MFGEGLEKYEENKCGMLIRITRAFFSYSLYLFLAGFLQNLFYLSWGDPEKLAWDKQFFVGGFSFHDLQILK